MSLDPSPHRQLVKDMAGILKIHSNTDGPLSTGHSWIEYSPVDGRSSTFGTWGNSPTGAGNGLLENAEADRSADATRTLIIDDEQERRLFKVINSYRAQGAQAWSLLMPCSAFAADAWEQVTGEHLVHKTAGISTPARLVKSIVDANQLELKAKQGLTPSPTELPRQKSKSSSARADIQPRQQKKRARRR
jgi:hypothetical protein